MFQLTASTSCLTHAVRFIAIKRDRCAKMISVLSLGRDVHHHLVRSAWLSAC